MLLSCTCNITESMRSVTEYYKKCPAILTRSIYGITSLEYLESNMTVNNLIKRNVSNPAKNSHRSKTRHVNEVLYNT